nr:E293 [uncultured bacterium]
MARREPGTPVPGSAKPRTGLDRARRAMRNPGWIYSSLNQSHRATGCR